MLPADMAMSSSYDLRVVAFSIVIAVLASYTALDLVGRVTAARDGARVAWLICGAIVMGIGIWSMHFVAMLAFSLPMAMAYDVGTVLLSMLPAIVASGGALFLASRRVLNTGQLLIGGVLMGIGIASMHYIGMAAMRMDASVHYNPVLFALSVAIAIGASIAALWISFQLRRTQTSKTQWRRKIGSAVIMGAAIAGMHYTGMAAANFTQTNATVASAPANHSLTWLAVAVGVATLIILVLALTSSVVDQRFAAQRKLLQQQESEAQRSQLFTETTLRIRRSLKMEDVLNIAVNEIRTVLNTDRAVIYRFHADGSGTIIAESVAEGWTKILGKTLNDPFPEEYMEMYRNGRVQATNNIQKAGFTYSHLETLERFQIKANLVAPILQDNQLMGLLCVHECSKRRSWHSPEIDLFKQLAIQVGIALEQATLLHELKQAHLVLRLRDRAIAAASNGIVITDPLGRDNPIVFCNPAFKTITGYSPQEVLGRNCQFLQGPDTDPATVEKISNAVHDASECQVVLKNYRKDGTPFWCELTVSPVRDASGRVINFIEVLTDITSRKQVEEELRYSKQLFQRQLLKLLSDVEEASKGDLTVRAEVSTDEIGIVADFFNTIIESLRQIVNQVKKAAQEVHSFVGENSNAIQQLADEALQQAEEITYTLNSVDKMTRSIQAVADNANLAAEVARTASDTAATGEAAMDRTVKSILNLRQTVTETSNKVKRLGQSSQEISKAVLLIDQIAMQTNLLSINVSVEAERAGDEGRCFAVLAEEVSHLATQCAEATKEIQQVVENIQLETMEVVKAMEVGTTQVMEGADLVEDAKLSLGRIVAESRHIDQLVQSISTATVSQAQTSQSVVSLMKQIATTSERSAASSSIVSSSLQQTVDVAQRLQASVGVFKTDVAPVQLADVIKEPSYKNGKNGKGSHKFTMN